MEEARLRPEDESEGGTADGSQLSWGWALLKEGWMAADAGVRSEEMDLDPALRVGGARRHPERAGHRHRLAVQAPRAEDLRLCAKHPDARKSLVHHGQPKTRASLRCRACGDRAGPVAPSSAQRNISLWVGETCT